MAIGQSGGRSAGNRTTGPRRATQRERAAIDPPGHSEWEHVRTEEEERTWVLTHRGEVVLNMFGLMIWLMFSVVLGVLVCAWWGLI